MRPLRFETTGTAASRQAGLIGDDDDLGGQFIDRAVPLAPVPGSELSWTAALSVPRSAPR